MMAILSRAAGWAIGLAVISLAGCASAPRVDPDVGRLSSVQRPQFVGASGPLSPGEVNEQIAHLAIEPGDAASLLHHIAVEEAVAESPLLLGGAIRLLPDGPTTLRAVFAAIRSARHEIDLEYYIMEDVGSDGTRLGDLLVAKRREGVAVNVIYDSFGSLRTPGAFFKRLDQAGVKLVEYNPINPFKARTRYSLNKRDHRKILIVDGARAIMGSVNLDRVDEASPAGGALDACHKAAACARDADVEIVGPGVAELQTMFFDHWRAQRGRPVEALNGPPVMPPKGDAVIRIIDSSPGRAGPRYYVTLISQLRSAEKAIFIETAFFVPTRDELEALKQAARRGVEVQIILPDHSASGLATAVSRSLYGELLKCGVKIYETHGVELHSKTMSVDGVWSVVGSSNLDYRSVIFNEEVDAEVLGDDTARGFQAMFETDRAVARPIDPKIWNRRPATARLMERFARVLQIWL
jgi:cardiolipin synthase